MNAKRTTLCCVVTLLMLTVTLESSVAATRQSALAFLDHRADPNYLVAVRPGDPYGYTRAVVTSLIGKQRTLLWMVAQPSFSPEYAVVLKQTEYEQDSAAPLTNRQAKRRQWVIEYAVAEEKIWQSREIGGGLSEPDIKPTEDVSRHQVVVTRDFAMKIRDAWLGVLKLTKHPHKPSLGIDGITFLFYCHCNFVGEIWTPRIGLPAELFELGRKLGEVARSGESDREVLKEQCLDLAASIVREANAQQDDATIRSSGIRRDKGRTSNAYTNQSNRITILIDGFESYDDEVDRICDTWTDGHAQGNDTNSMVGHLQAPFAERAIIRSGRQSMPLRYDNTAAPFYSETSRTWPTAQDWTANGANTLMLFVRGNGNNSPSQLHIAIEDESKHTATVIHPDPNILVTDQWTQWVVPLPEFGDIDLASIRAMHISIGDQTKPTPGGLGLIYLDDILLINQGPR